MLVAKTRIKEFDCSSAEEQDLIDRAKKAMDQSNWTIGECASRWTTKYARGRRDREFAAIIGASRKTVSNARLTWDRFKNWNSRSKLSFTHFREARGWKNAEEILEWAIENNASVKQMKAHRNRSPTVPAEPTKSRGKPTPSAPSMSPLFPGLDGSGFASGVRERKSKAQRLKRASTKDRKKNMQPAWSDAANGSLMQAGLFEAAQLDPTTNDCPSASLATINALVEQLGKLSDSEFLETFSRAIAENPEVDEKEIISQLNAALVGRSRI